MVSMDFQQPHLYIFQQVHGKLFLNSLWIHWKDLTSVNVTYIIPGVVKHTIFVHFTKSEVFVYHSKSCTIRIYWILLHHRFMQWENAMFTRVHVHTNTQQKTLFEREKIKEFFGWLNALKVYYYSICEFHWSYWFLVITYLAHLILFI